MADFEEHREALERLGATIVAASADTEEEARGIIEDLGLGFTVLYGLDAEETSRRIGCYTGVRQGRPHIQPAAFVLRPDGTVAHAVYSSGKVGRFTASDAATILKATAASVESG